MPLLPRSGRRTATATAMATVAVLVAAGLAPATAAAGAVPPDVPPPVAVAAPAAALAPGVSTSIDWEVCSDDSGPRIECAVLTVPRDWANPSAGPTVDVAFQRVAATGPAAGRKGVIMTNPGGPGGNGNGLEYVLAATQPAVAAAYDLVGMDPRGVRSFREDGTTSLECVVELDGLEDVGSYDSRDLSRAAVASRQTLAKAIADACAENPLTPFITTWQTAHDMDHLRRLMGQDRLNYIGYSYGSWLGAKYAALFPQRAGKLVLDANTAWMDDLSASWQLMPMAFQRRWSQQLLTWTARTPAFAVHVGDTPAEVNASYEQARAAYEAFTPQGGQVLDSALLGALYADEGFPPIAVTLVQLKVCLAESTDRTAQGLQACLRKVDEQLTRDLPRDEASPQLLAEAQAAARAMVLSPASVRTNNPALAAVRAVTRGTGPSVSLGGVYFAVRCGDGGTWHSPSWYENYQRKLAPDYPLAAHAILGTEVCAHWTAPTTPLPNPRGDAPIVVVQTEFDPATAYESTHRNLAQYRAGRLIGVQDSGIHGTYGFRGNGCVDDTVNRWLLSDVVPDATTVCGTSPLPYESTVVPRPGPMDGSSSPRSTRATVVDPKLRRMLKELVVGPV